MFFLLSKLFWVIISPLNFVWIVIFIGFVYGLVTKRQQINTLLMAGVFLFLTLGILPVGYNLMVFLERQYDRPARLPDKVDGIIVLGGGFNAELAHQTGMMVANGEINRVIDFVALGQKYPKAKLVYSGGTGKVFYQELGESPIAKEFLKLTAIDEGRVIYEEKSRNTYENIMNSKEVVKPMAGEVWVVVTAFSHMPRAMGIMKKLDWPAIAYPSSPKTLRQYRWLPAGLDVSNNFYLLGNAIKEGIGSVVYYFSGKSAFLLPLSSLDSAS